MDKVRVDEALVEVHVAEEGVVEEHVQNLVDCAHFPPLRCSIGDKHHNAVDSLSILKAVRS